MKRILTALIVLTLAAAVLSGCAIIRKLAGTGGGQKPPEQTGQVTAGEDSPAPSETAAVSPVTPTAAVLPSVVSDTYVYESEYIDVSIETPVVAGLPDALVLERVNAVFADYGGMSKNSIQQLEDESRQLVEDGYAPGAPYMLYVGCTVDYNKNGLLCVTLSEYSYRGGAHGSEVRLSLIFDLATGNRLYLSDLMKEGSGYRDFINSRIREEIDRRVQNEELYELAAFEDIGDVPDFYLADDGLVFYFQEYAYFPYAAGIQEFLITYADLSEFLNAQYHLS